jgi:hypothetical protein
MAIDSAFKQAEDTFHQLKSQLRSGEISRREFLDELKKLQLKDDQGRLWMIGSQSGKWYYLKGKDWIQSDPPAAKEAKAICPYCGFENKPNAAICARCGGGIGEFADVCPKCGAKLVPPLYECPRCGKPETGELPAPAPTREAQRAPGPKPERMVLTARALKPVSFFFFGGTFGLFLGILAGAFIGATGALPGLVSALPSFFRENQGRLLGAIVFAASSGVFWFVAGGALFYLLSLLVNLILSLTGGLKFVLSGEAPKARPASQAAKAKDSLLDL